MYNNAILRFKEIVGVFASYGFGHFVDSKLKKNNNSPRNLRKAFEELGPTFIKIGQILSTRPDIISEPYILELSKLQDNVPPVNFYHANNIFFQEFNKNIENCFYYFNKIPLASASIAQVYDAILRNGQQVIVKIQRPHILEEMKTDIHILSKLVNIATSYIPDAFIDPKEAIKELKATTDLELDFEKEASNAKKFKELNSKVACIYTPYIIEEFSGKRVITMEKINGFKIDNIKKIQEEGYDFQDVSKKLALSYFKQVFTDGFFHGDPHPGNILIQESKISFIDFGIMGSFNSSIKDAMNKAIISVALKDPDKLLSVILSIAVRKGYVNKNILYEDIQYLFDAYIYTSLRNIKVSILLQEIFNICKKNNLLIPKDLIILSRSMLIIEGVVAKLNPDMNILDIAIPFVKANNSNDFFKNLNSEEMLLNSYCFFNDISKLPSKIIALSDNILNGRLKIQLNLSNIDKSTNEVNKMTNRLVFGIIVSSMIIGSSMILTSNIGPTFYGISLIGITGYGLSAVMALWLLLSILKSGKM